MTPDYEELTHCAGDLGAVALYLHGSHALGTARPDSDLDLAVLLPRESPIPFEEAAERLALCAGVDPERVDVQDLGSAPALFRSRVVTAGRLLFVSDPTGLAAFQARSLTEAWDEEIFLRPIHQAMRRRIREGRFAS